MQQTLAVIDVLSSEQKTALKELEAVQQRETELKSKNILLERYADPAYASQAEMKHLPTSTEAGVPSTSNTKAAESGTRKRFDMAGY